MSARWSCSWVNLPIESVGDAQQEHKDDRYHELLIALQVGRDVMTFKRSAGDIRVPAPRGMAVY